MTVSFLTPLPPSGWRRIKQCRHLRRPSQSSRQIAVVVWSNDRSLLRLSLAPRTLQIQQRYLNERNSHWSFLVIFDCHSESSFWKDFLASRAFQLKITAEHFQKKFSARVPRVEVIREAEPTRNNCGWKIYEIIKFHCGKVPIRIDPRAHFHAQLNARKIDFSYSRRENFKLQWHFSYIENSLILTIAQCNLMN